MDTKRFTDNNRIRGYEVYSSDEGTDGLTPTNEAFDSHVALFLKHSMRKSDYSADKDMDGSAHGHNISRFTYD